ncbi:MAG: RNA polymerase sigma factor [Candidatus Gracilibacteria bacterium]|nr:RNA polymerase sigma factor [Candidatus Gracilibacteria bacterium]MDQ7022212.1 RNA polymerase sigma factor [Candidatus Gracilibacteria bacterium]
MLDCNKYTDKDIIALVSSGEINAFYCLVEKYEKKLLNYILRITNISYEDAENLLQDIFLKVYTNINSYNSEYSFSSWIYRIAHNYTIDYYKKHKNKQNIDINSGNDDENVNFLELLQSDENIEENILTKELILKIKKILNTLDIKYEEILILKFLEEKNYREISDILKIPEGTVATLINRGKKQFREKAEEQNLINYL